MWVVALHAEYDQYLDALVLVPVPVPSVTNTGLDYQLINTTCKSVARNMAHLIAIYHYWTRY